MNKFLYILVIAFFCLACAKEVKGDDLFIESTLKQVINEQQVSTSDAIFNSKKELVVVNTNNKLLKKTEVALKKVNTKADNKTKKVVKKSDNIISDLDLKGNTNSNKNQEKTIYRTLFDERKITKLFTDPSAHSKRYKAPRTIALKNAQIKYQDKNSIAQKKAITSFIKESKPENKKGIKQTTKQKENSLFNTKNLTVKILNKKNGYKTNKTYTIITQITNNEANFEQVYIEANLPKEWKIISISKIDTLNVKDKKLCLISFYIPSQYKPGNAEIYFKIKNKNSIIKNQKFNLNIESNYDLEIFSLTSPKQLQAGELIESKFEIKNNGNTVQKISLSTRNTLETDRVIFLHKDSTVLVRVSQKTDKKANSFRRISTNLEVLNVATKKRYYKTNSTEVIPTSIKQKDAYFRYPVETSLYYNSFTKKGYHYSTLSAEIKGNGFLDVDKNHRLDFLFRAPKKQNLRYFSVVDQYSLIYKYKNSTTLYLGDHAYNINRLGYSNRYGMGFKIDHDVKKWTLSTFYSKPRLFDFNNKPIYGVKAVYNKSDSIRVGVSLVKSEGNNYSYKNQIRQDDKGQIATLDYYYRHKNTYVEAEMSTSFNANNLDYASRLNFSQRFKNMSLNSNLTYASKNYLGAISNSIQYNNSIAYFKNGFNMGLGHAVSKVNRKLDPILYEVEPYYENFYATLGYRYSRKHAMSFRFDKRIREDQLDPINYKYQEYGFDYRFNYTDKFFTGSFGGRFAKTQNLLLGNQKYRNTYTHNLNVAYRLFSNLSVRGALNHTYTNRYGYSGLNQNYYRYNAGVNYNISRALRINANYNSGFSPEGNYRKRDYVNLNINARINKHHNFQVRANYFENPAVVDNKQLQAFVKYTYSFGIGVKRLFDQGGVKGYITTNNNDLNTKGIKMFAAGKTVVTDKFGNFELNNLEIGKNYIYLDESSLPVNVVLAQKNPIEVIVDKDKSDVLEIKLVKAGNLLGNLNLTNKDKSIEKNLESYIKLTNKNFTYYTESDKKGNFKFKNIVPGDYTFTLIRFKNNGKQFSLNKNTTLSIKEGKNVQLNINVKGKERKIKFINNNLKVSYND